MTAGAFIAGTVHWTKAVLYTIFQLLGGIVGALFLRVKGVFFVACLLYYNIYEFCRLCYLQEAVLCHTTGSRHVTAQIGLLQEG